MTPEEFAAAVASSPKGTNIIYFTGYYLTGFVSDIRNAAWIAHERDEVSLVQRKIVRPGGESQFEYIAQVRR